MEKSLKRCIIIVLFLMAMLLNACGAKQIFIALDEVDHIDGYYFDRHGVERFPFEVDEKHYGTLVDWFNESSDLRANPDFAGTVPPMAKIDIWKQGGYSVSISLAHDDFEVQGVPEGESKAISYWAKQPQLKQLLWGIYEGGDVNELIEQIQAEAK